MLHKIPEFDKYFVAHLKNDPAKEPVAASYSAPGVLAEAAAKSDITALIRMAAPTGGIFLSLTASKMRKRCSLRNAKALYD
jgi:hypothetical protein